VLLDWPALVAKYSLRIEGVIHCGARLGEERDAYASVGCSNVWWVEGNPYIIHRLKANVESYGHRVIQALLTNEDHGRRTFNITNNEGMSSSVFEFGTHPTFSPETVFQRREELETRTLDSLVEEHRIADINFLNMDLQGAEKLVLQGATNLIPQLRYVMTEVNNAEVYVGCAKIEELDEILHDFDRVETHWVAEQGWGDAMYLRRR